MSVSDEIHRFGNTYKHNQLEQTLAAHQHSDAEALSPPQLAEAGCESSADDLPREGAGDDADDIRPGNAIIEQAEIGAQAGEGKVKRQEQDGNKVLDLLGQLDGKATVMRADDAD